ncbi:MAG: leucine--tRNA ligase [Chloroflexota bacterium]|nr:leucine--tRNA ligase [Chloroflexota bacterium]
MSDKYQPHAIEVKWQREWEATELYRSKVDWSKPKHYALTMLPYPSGDLHIGHWFAMTPSDARARWMRMKGYNVLFPMGFDAFGLPAEQAAISNNIHPWKWTYANIERMREQLRSMGAMFDWEREAISCTPEYYKWSEWFFKKFYEHGLAYRGSALVNWSETLQTVLANEQVIDGKDERMGQPVVHKMMEQWFFAITRYADELLNFKPLDWPESIKIMQTNWIGRSEGARATFRTEVGGHPIEIYTTRPDTLWGATFMVLAPEHDLVEKITTEERRPAVRAYVERTALESEIERMVEDREKTGVFTGAFAINPVNDERIPIWIADYVMITYGTGAIMAVPAHDQRDFEFARAQRLPVRVVIQPVDAAEALDGDTMSAAYDGPGLMVNSDAMDGSESTWDKGRKNPAINRVIDWLEATGKGEEAVNYRLRDWLISRQRYWGSPIPMIFDGDAVIPVDDEQLPVELPEDVDFMPTGRSPLTYHEPFYKVDEERRRETDTLDTFMCSSWYQLRYLSPECESAPFDAEEAAYWLPVDVYTGGAEHAVMHLLYTRFFTKALRDIGLFDDAAEAMRRNGRDPAGAFDEPMTVLRNQGQVLGGERQGDFVLCSGRQVGGRLLAERVEVVEWNQVPPGFAGVFGEIAHRTENVLHVDMAGITQFVDVQPDAEIIIPDIAGENNVNQLRHHLDIQRMSKSKGNVVNPDELVAEYGADVMRCYLMFNFDWQKGGPWNENNIKGPQGWLGDVWEIAAAGAPNAPGDPSAERDIERKLHQTIAVINRGLEEFSFNTAIAEQMKFKNALKAALRAGGIGAEVWHSVMNQAIRLLAPFAPHIAEELWAMLGWEYSVHRQPWPEYDAEKAREEQVDLVVMINGKPRETISVAVDIAQERAQELALASGAAQRFLDGKAPRRTIFIPGRNGTDPKVNIVV